MRSVVFWCVVQPSKQSTAAPIFIKPKNLAEKVITCDASCRHCRLLCPPHSSHHFKKKKKKGLLGQKFLQLFIIIMTRYDMISEKKNGTFIYK